NGRSLSSQGLISTAFFFINDTHLPFFGFLHRKLWHSIVFYALLIISAERGRVRVQSGVIAAPADVRVSGDRLGDE
ncbi:hypothetical protein, partial [Cronobacter sakazakii]|uniref:hypothetical protein n=1 Tax=Cronobacter sakazakii TaxID=28141 RepID=UPI00294ACFBB